MLSLPIILAAALGFKIALGLLIGSLVVVAICALVALSRRHDESTRGRW